MAPYEFRVALEAAGHPGEIYHVRVWVRRTLDESGPEGWTCVYERQVDAGSFPGEPSKQWRSLIRAIKP